MTLHIDDSEFEAKVLKGQGAFLVDFWAEWCGPCRQIAPILDEIAKERAGKITIAKVNIDKNPGTPQKYGVRGIPTLIIFKDGKAALLKHLADGGTYERYFVVLNEPVREAIAVKLIGIALKNVAKSGGTPVPATATEAKKGGFFSKMFGKR